MASSSNVDPFASIYRADISVVTTVWGNVTRFVNIPAAIRPGDGMAPPSLPAWGGTLAVVMFRPEALRGAPEGGLDGMGQVNYRLARNAVVSQFVKGRLSRLDVCDAHPELVRAARNIGEPTTEPCPICDEATVVLVSYVFGPGLPASGRCVTSKREVARLPRGAGDLACYVVEVCPACRWNHLAHSFPLGRRQRAKA
jgi:hypothetical protein